MDFKLSPLSTAFGQQVHTLQQFNWNRCGFCTRRISRYDRVWCPLCHTYVCMGCLSVHDGLVAKETIHVHTATQKRLLMITSEEIDQFQQEEDLRQADRALHQEQEVGTKVPKLTEEELVDCWCCDMD